MVSLAAQYETVLIACSDGTFSADVRPLVRMDVSVIVEQGGKREQAHAGGGGRGIYTDFFGGETPEDLARRAVRQALVQLDAVAALLHEHAICGIQCIVDVATKHRLKRVP